MHRWANPLTDSGHNLRLQTKLVAESSSKVVDTTLSVSRYVGNFTDMIEHMPTSEEEYGDQTKGSP